MRAAESRGSAQFGWGDSPGARPRRGGRKRAIEYIHIAIDVNRLRLLRQILESRGHHAFDSSRANLVHWNDRNARGTGYFKIRARVGEWLNADLRDLRARQTVCQQCAYWIAVGEAGEIG